HVNNVAEFGLESGNRFFVQKCLDIGDRALDWLTVHRIGDGAEVRLQTDGKILSCVFDRYACDSHCRKTLMVDDGLKRTAGVASIVCDDDHSWITTHHSILSEMAY